MTTREATRHWSEQIEEFEPGPLMGGAASVVARKARYLALADVIDAREFVMVGDELGRPAGDVGPVVWAVGPDGWEWLTSTGHWFRMYNPDILAELDRRLALVSS